MADRNQNMNLPINKLADATKTIESGLKELVDNLPDKEREVNIPRAFEGQFQLLVNQLFNQAGEHGQLKTLMWLGSGRGVGVTTAVTYFARFFAGRLSQRVLLIDANYLNTSLHHQFVVPPKPGLSEYLAGTAQPQEAVRRIANVERLYVMPAGDKALLPRTLLSGTANVRERLDRLARHFDLVLLDSAPVTMSPESFNLVSKVDGVLVVSMAERTRREVLGATRDQLKQAGAQVLGGVLNRRKFHIPHMLYRWLG